MTKLEYAEAQYAAAVQARIIWTAAFDMATIPDSVLRSEMQRRNARKRVSYTGGAIWKRHNPGTPRCRCAKCAKVRREEERILVLRSRT